MKRYIPRIEVWTWGPAVMLAGFGTLALQIAAPSVRVGAGMILFGCAAVWVTVWSRWDAARRQTDALYTEAARVRKEREDALVARLASSEERDAALIARNRETSRQVVEKCLELEAATAELQDEIKRARAA